MKITSVFPFRQNKSERSADLYGEAPRNPQAEDPIFNASALPNLTKSPQNWGLEVYPPSVGASCLATLFGGRSLPAVFLAGEVLYGSALCCLVPCARVFRVLAVHIPRLRPGVEFAAHFCSLFANFSLLLPPFPADKYPVHSPQRYRRATAPKRLLCAARV